MTRSRKRQQLVKSLSSGHRSGFTQTHVLPTESQSWSSAHHREVLAWYSGQSIHGERHTHVGYYIAEGRWESPPRTRPISTRALSYNPVYWRSNQLHLSWHSHLRTTSKVIFELRCPVCVIFSSSLVLLSNRRSGLECLSCCVQWRRGREGSAPHFTRLLFFCNSAWSRDPAMTTRKSWRSSGSLTYARRVKNQACLEKLSC